MSGISEELGRKIGSAQDLQSIVRSMKALAASNIGQYERAVAALHDYYRTVELAVRACSGGAARPSPPKAQNRAASVGALVFGSDQGLVGRFNEALAEFATQSLGALPGRTTKIWVVGERMEALMGMPARTFAAPNSVDAIGDLVGEILIDMAAAEQAREIREVYVFHNAPGPAATYGAGWCGVYCRSTPSGRAIWRRLRGPRGRYPKSFRAMSQRSRPSFASTCSSCCFKPAPSLSPARMPAAWRPCSAQRRTSRTCSMR